MTDVDVVVIGSGAGGLTAAVALAQAGQKVLVLEQHYLPGGWCHSFPLGGYRFSPGVHYIGELGEGGMARRVYEGLGLGDDLSFYALNPDGYDHVLVGGTRFDIPAGREKYTERLKSRFPAEAAGIDRYLGTMARVGQDLAGLLDLDGVLDAVTLPFRAPTLARWGFRSTAALLDSCVKDPVLRTILAAQSGDHGLPPSRAPVAIHAAVTGHYWNGGYYPRGGAYTLPRAFIRALRRAGGAIKVRAEVSQIMVEGGRAIGVRLADGTTIRAKHVVSNADPHVTFDRLVGPAHLSSRLRKRLATTRYSSSALSLFMAVDADARAYGLDSGNFWYYRTPDLERVYDVEKAPWGLDGQDLAGMFLTVTTLKDPSKRYRGHHTMEAFTFVSYEAFRAWSSSRYGERPESYQAMKRDLTALMLRGVAAVAPGIEKHVVFAELGTPLTNQFYVAATGGNLYGTEKSRWQIGPFGFMPGTEIPGLTLCGASTLSHGVMGATLSGLVAARSILRCPFDDLLKTRGGAVTLLDAETAGRLPPPASRAEPTAPAGELATDGDFALEGDAGGAGAVAAAGDGA